MTQHAPSLQMRSAQVFVFLAALAGAACNGPDETAMPAASRSVPVPPGDAIARPPRALAARPIDLALFGANEVRKYVSVSGDNYPNGRGDLPWILGNPGEHFSSQEFLSSDASSRRFDWKQTPYWCAELPASVTVSLREPSYVSRIEVRPFFGLAGPFRVTAMLLDASGQRIEPVPPAEFAVTTEEEIARSAKGIPFVMSFHPRLATQVELGFTAIGNGPALAYIDAIRILGHPAAQPQAVLGRPNEDARARIASSSTDVARIDPLRVPALILASEDRDPNGAAAYPWLAQKEETPSPYWSAAAPAWVEVRLPEPAYIHRVLVQPWTEKNGAAAFYAKVVTPGGIELDTVPPIEGAYDLETSDATDRKLPPLIADFEPVFAERLKFYFPSPGAGSELLYIQDIRVFGVPVQQ